METSILQHIKKITERVFEPQALESGRVLEVRVWESATMIEVDIHLPFAHIQEWNEVPYIKFLVNDQCIRDYTPFGWDAATATCSLLIDTAHDGPGSRWAKSLRAGDNIQYIKIKSTRQTPHPENLIVGLGDSSSLGHLLALQQLNKHACRFEAVALLNSPRTGQLFSDYFRLPVNMLTSHGELAKWLIKQDYCTARTSFYLTGNRQMIIVQRGILKNLGYQDIQAKGFWS